MEISKGIQEKRVELQMVINKFQQTTYLKKNTLKRENCLRLSQEFHNQKIT
ncbi:unnamed protein product [Paramecium sonneborni]|uniref:Uncharacterized protein n=1 Tax=Paramecium sonneborni TaxID=65129 RepID=A0A8S1QLE5_9CILI|nr:unnamed protein product [Paramecium sonneborni]